MNQTFKPFPSLFLSQLSPICTYLEPNYLPPVLGSYSVQGQFEAYCAFWVPINPLDNLGSGMTLHSAGTQKVRLIPEIMMGQKGTSSFGYGPQTISKG